MVAAEGGRKPTWRASLLSLSLNLSFLLPAYSLPGDQRKRSETVPDTLISSACGAVVVHFSLAKTIHGYYTSALLDV